MTAPQRFLFERCFDSAPIDEPACVQTLEIPTEVEPLPPAFSEEDVARAREEGRTEGRSEALAEAAQSQEQRVAAAIETVSGALATLFEAQRNASSEAARQAIDVAVGITRKVVPELARRNAIGEVEHVVETALDAFHETPPLTIRVCPDLHADVSERLATSVATGIETDRLDIVADARIATTDCIVEWRGGGMERRCEDVWKEIDAIIEETLKPAGEASAPAVLSAPTDGPSETCEAPPEPLPPALGDDHV